MALTDSSTLTEVCNQFLANSDWYGNRSKAAARKESIDWLLIKRPVSMSVGGRSQALDYQRLQNEVDQLGSFLNASASGRPAMFSRGVIGGMGR